MSKLSYMLDSLSAEDVGRGAFALAHDLFPICRSITGDGVRETLNIVKQHVPLEIHEVPTGTAVFDWQVPKEWNIRDAYIKDSTGKKLVDFKESNLHVVGYSCPIKRTVKLDELREHLYTLPDHAEWIPYRTSYYQETWGFCVSYKQMQRFKDNAYEVCIDSSLVDGYLTYGEYIHKGITRDEILLTTHVCHPSLANDNLSGIAVLTYLAKYLSKFETKYTYRFLWIPGTIGSITWLAINADKVNRIKHGLVLSCVGDGGGPVYKQSRSGMADIDRIMEYILRNSFKTASIEEFSPYGYDERQFCSPGFNLPVGLFQRSKHGKFPQYHTSADNLDFIKPAHLAESLMILMEAMDTIERNDIYIRNNPFCEPQLGRRGLYSAIGGDKSKAVSQMALLWVLNLSDGDHSILDIALRSKIPFREISHAASLLNDKGLIETVRS